MVTETSAIGGAALLITIAIYQMALAFGAPLGEPAFSLHPEAGDKVLSPPYRLVSGFSALLVALAAWVIAARGGVISTGGLSRGLLTGLTWFIGGYLVVDALVNLNSASVIKRWLGGCTKVAAAFCCVAVAITAG